MFTLYYIMMDTSEYKHNLILVHILHQIIRIKNVTLIDLVSVASSTLTKQANIQLGLLFIPSSPICNYRKSLLHNFFQAVLLLSMMKSSIVGDPIQRDRLHDAVDFLLSIMVRNYGLILLT